MWVRLMFRDSRLERVSPHKPPEMLPGDWEESLISARAGGIFKQGISSRKQGFKIGDQRLYSVIASLESCDGKIAAGKVIACECNNF